MTIQNPYLSNLNRADYLLAFAQYYPYGPDYYIFGGMYKIEKILPEVYDAYGYKLTLLPDFEDYRKRLIIHLARPRLSITQTTLRAILNGS